MEEFIEIMQDVFERDEIEMKDTFRDYDEWDSITLLSLTAALNDDYDVTIPREEFEKIETVQELYDYINK